MNRSVIEEFRRHSGRVPSRKAPILLLTTKGARTGRERVNPLNYSRDGEGYVVMASKGGAPKHPDWFHNLAKYPDVTVEAEGERFPARARVTTGAERARLVKNHIAEMPFFGGYERQVKSRQIPVIVLERIG